MTNCCANSAPAQNLSAPKPILAVICWRRVVRNRAARFFAFTTASISAAFRGGTCFCTSRDVQKHVPPKFDFSALGDCDVFVLASAPDERGARDIFPTVIAEAMATGRPVVSTTVAGIPELVANGETGLLVPPGDARALANAMEQLAGNENLRGDFGRAGRLRIEQKFTIEKTIEPLLERFEQITEGCPE